MLIASLGGKSFGFEALPKKVFKISRCIVSSKIFCEFGVKWWQLVMTDLHCPKL